MLLYMIRHGETENNFLKKHSGHSLTSLTEKGIEDGKRAGEKLKGISFDKVFTSDLPRTQQTAKSALPDCEFEILSLIKEIDVGRCTDRRVSECEAEWGELYIKCKADFDYTPFGGENSDMLRDRARRFFKMLEESGYETVAAFSHGAFIKHTLDVVLDANLDKLSYYTNNGGIFVYEYKNEKWRLKGWNL